MVSNLPKNAKIEWQAFLWNHNRASFANFRKRKQVTESEVGLDDEDEGSYLEDVDLRASCVNGKRTNLSWVSFMCHP